ncbi:hypothetical protein CEXT_179531, partial [Caerostris extrusa]
MLFLPMAEFSDFSLMSESTLKKSLGRRGPSS